MRLTHIIILSGILRCTLVSGAPQQLEKLGGRVPLPSRSNEQASLFQQSVLGMQENHVRARTEGGVDASDSTTSIHFPQDDIQRARRSTIVNSGDISWISPEGQKISMNYITDENGFRLQNNGFSIEDNEESLPPNSKDLSAASIPPLTGSSLSLQTMEDRAAQEFGFGRRYYFATRHGSQKLNPRPSEDLTLHQNVPPSRTYTSSTPFILPLMKMQPTPPPTLPQITAQSAPQSLSLESSYELPVSTLPVHPLLPSSFNQLNNRLQLQSSSFPVDLTRSSLVTTNRLAEHELAINRAPGSSVNNCKEFIPDPALFKMDPRNLSLSDRQQLLHYILVALTTESRIDGCSHGCTRFGSTRNASEGTKKV